MFKNINFISKKTFLFKLSPFDQYREKFNYIKIFNTSKKFSTEHFIFMLINTEFELTIRQAIIILYFTNAIKEINQLNKIPGVL